jgi:hypothetical protein
LLHLVQLAVNVYAIYQVVRFMRRAWILENLLTVFGRAILKTGQDWSKTVEDPMAQEYLRRLEAAPSSPPPSI